MKKGMICLMLFVAAGWLVTGCGDEEKESTAPSVGVASIAPDTMVAKVNGKEITVAMLNQQINAMMQQYAQQVPPDQLSKLKPMLRQQAVAALVNQELLQEEADKEGVSPSSDEIDAELEKIVAQFPTREQFDTQLAQAGVTDADLRRISAVI